MVDIHVVWWLIIFVCILQKKSHSHGGVLPRSQSAFCKVTGWDPNHSSKCWAYWSDHPSDIYFLWVLSV